MTSTMLDVVGAAQSGLLHSVQNQSEHLLLLPELAQETVPNEGDTRRRRDAARGVDEADGRGRPTVVVVVGNGSGSLPSSSATSTGSVSGSEGGLEVGGVNLVKDDNDEDDVDEEEDAYDSCCICFDGKEFVLTSCCHLFCLPCITRWIEISGTCPICRNEFDTGVELYNLIGTVEDTIRAIKEVHKRKRELEWRRKELAMAQQREREGSLSGSSSVSWGIFHQVMDLLFPASVDGERMTLGGRTVLEDDDDTVALAPHLNLTRVNLNALNSNSSNTSTGRAHLTHHQINVAPSFPFLSFCCLPHQSSASVAMPPVFSSMRNRIL